VQAPVCLFPYAKLSLFQDFFTVLFQAFPLAARCPVRLLRLIELLTSPRFLTYRTFPRLTLSDPHRCLLFVILPTAQLLPSLPLYGASPASTSLFVFSKAYVPAFFPPVCPPRPVSRKFLAPYPPSSRLLLQLLLCPFDQIRSSPVPELFQLVPGPSSFFSRHLPFFPSSYD